MKVKLVSWEKFINFKIFFFYIKKSENLDWEIGTHTRLGVKNLILLNIQYRYRYRYIYRLIDELKLIKLKIQQNQFLTQANH